LIPGLVRNMNGSKVPLTAVPQKAKSPAQPQGFQIQCNKGNA